MKKGKLWGITEALLQTGLVELHRIEADPRCRCSTHTHAQKFNLFYVLEGQLYVGVESENGFDETHLIAGEWTTVAPGVAHYFRTGDFGVRALELYYLAPLSPDDIARRSPGRRGSRRR